MSFGNLIPGFHQYQPMFLVTHKVFCFSLKSQTRVALNALSQLDKKFTFHCIIVFFSPNFVMLLKWLSCIKQISQICLMKVKI
jgi:hypothetical protein